MTYLNNLLLWKEQNQLLSIELKSLKNNRTILLGRLIQYDVKNNSLQLYLDDEKTLCNLLLDDINNISPASLNICEKISLKEILKNRKS